MYVWCCQAKILKMWYYQPFWTMSPNWRRQPFYNLGSLLTLFWHGHGSIFEKGPLALAFQATDLPIFLLAQLSNQYQRDEKKTLWETICQEHTSAGNWELQLYPWGGCMWNVLGNTNSRFEKWIPVWLQIFGASLFQKTLGVLGW